MEGLEESAGILERWNEWRDILRFVLNHCENTTSEPGAGVGSTPSNSNELPRGSNLDNINAVLQPLAKKIQTVRSKSNSDGKGVVPISESAHFSIVAQSLGYYIMATLTPSEIESLSSDLDAGTSNWLKNLLGLPRESVGIFSPDESRARFLVAQAALSTMVGYNTKGFELLSTVNPVIYVGETLAPIAENLCFLLGFPRRNIHFINIPYGGGSGTIDIATLEEAIEKDRTEGRTPFMVIATTDLSQADDLTQIKQVCAKNHLWMHVEGDGLALLMAKSKCPAAIAMAIQADSFTITPSKWYGLTAAPVWTRFAKTVPSALTKAHSTPLSSLGLWMFLQRAGQDYLEQSVTRSIELAQKVQSALSELSTINLESSMIPTVLFRYAPDLPEGEAASIVNNLNQQILIDLSANSTAANLGLQLVSSDTNTTYILFQPLFSIDVFAVTDEIIGEFINILKMETTLIDATLQCRDAFLQSTAKFKDLINVKVDNFVGLGAVRYVPSYLSQSLDTLAPDVAQEIDHLNTTLAHRLGDDPLFAESKTTEGSTCVSLGVDTKPITPEAVEAYVQKLYKTAQQIEISSKIVEKIAAFVQKGIKQAQDELNREEANNLYQEGIVRKLPLVGSVWNWMLPFEKPQLQGRSFDLASQSLQTVSSPKLRNRVVQSPSTESLRNSIDRPSTPASLHPSASSDFASLQRSESQDKPLPLRSSQDKPISLQSSASQDSQLKGSQEATPRASQDSPVKPIQETEVVEQVQETSQAKEEGLA